MSKMNIHMTDFKKYINDLIPPTTDWAQKLETYADENHVPIIEKDGIHFLTQLVKIKCPKNILEIGTAIGYSALKMHEAYPKTMITTLERNDKMFSIAEQNIIEQQKEEQIHIIHGDALETIAQMQMTDVLFDFVFIDAAKGQYKKFFQLVEPLLTDDAVIVCDNILFKGFVVEPLLTEQKRLQKLTNKIKEFNEWLMNHPSYQTSIVPIGDGMSISMKK